MTGIPTSSLLISEKDRLLHLENHLRQRVVGQDHALAAVANAVRLSRAGLAPPNRPIANLMFVGSTGSGKTELCKALAKFLFDDEAAMVRIDMTEYSEPHTISRLIGSPPGYIGSDQGGQLTEAVRRRPHSLVVFDEAEKAARQVLNLLLQVMDDGFLTDAQGHKVDFRNTVIILTSNLGSDVLATLPENSPPSLAKDAVMGSIRSHLPPEFINRLDDIILFNKLSQTNLRGIVDLRIRDIGRMLAEKEIGFRTADEQVADWLAREGYDPTYGARPLRRLIQRRIMNPLASALIDGAMKEGDTVVARMADVDNVVFDIVDNTGKTVRTIDPRKEYAETLQFENAPEGGGSLNDE
jgi:ATP-dependent Clp protease ATP-binding subunit ClpB